MAERRKNNAQEKPHKRIKWADLAAQIDLHIGIIPHVPFHHSIDKQPHDKLGRRNYPAAAKRTPYDATRAFCVDQMYAQVAKTAGDSHSPMGKSAPNYLNKPISNASDGKKCRIFYAMSKLFQLK